MIEDIGDLGRFLGRHHTTVSHAGHEQLAFDMRAYARDTIQDYVNITNTKTFKKAHTPFLAKVAEHLDDDEATGELASSASSVLMKLMWISRLARPDVLRATTWLATKVQKWSRSCDAHLHRVMCYLYHSQENMLTGWINDPTEELFVEMFVDADFCGDDEDCYSTSGGWIQLSGPSTQFPLAWLSKKQSTVARSTTEAETVALSYVLYEEGLSMLELWKQLLQRDVKLRVREDNEATAKIVLAGYSKRLRHLRRTQKIHLASLSEQLNQPDIELMLVNTLFQKADVFTKAVAGPLWENAMKLLSILWDYKILHTSSTGLKMNFENLDEALGPSYGEVQPGPKPMPKATMKKRKKKAQRILPYARAPEDGCG